MPTMEGEQVQSSCGLNVLNLLAVLAFQPADKLLRDAHLGRLHNLEAEDGCFGTTAVPGLGNAALARGANL